MSTNFANQRRTFAPIKNTKDWKLFQTFRYGKDKLKYEFDVKDDYVNNEFVVELYFVEPWLGIGGGINAKGMRMFDVAINGKTVLKDLDIWNEVGVNKVLKKSIVANVVDGKIVISFPKSKVGQAIISAIAIREKNYSKGKSASTKVGYSYSFNGWLDIGDKVFTKEDIRFNSLPSNLFGANWLKIDSIKEAKIILYRAYQKSDLFFAVKSASEENKLFQKFENTNTQIVTDEDGGTKYNVYKKRFAKDDTMTININSNIIVCMQPVTNMQPAYDLKPTVSYRTATAKLNGDGLVKSMVNEKETISFNKNQTSIEWNINIGAADIYSLNIRYANPSDKILSGTLQIIMADGTIIKNEKITFTPSNKGKWNYISTNTNSMVNAGNYVVRIIAADAIGVGISGVDVQ